MFNPRAVVIVGVSKGRDWGGTHYLETFREYNYAGPVYPVNPKYEGEEIHGYKVYGQFRLYQMIHQSILESWLFQLKSPHK